MKMRQQACKGQEEQKEKVEQRKRLQEFDKELFSYTGQIAWFIPGIFSIVVLGLMCIPVQELGREYSVMKAEAFVCAVWIPYCVLQPYVMITDTFERSKSNRNRTYDKLKYLPVGKNEYISVRMGYLFRFVWKLALAGAAVQCLSAALSLGRVEFVNAAYAAGVLLIMPLAAGWIQLKLGT